MEDLRIFLATVPAWLWNLLLFAIAVLAGFSFKWITVLFLRRMRNSSEQYSLFRSAVSHLNSVVNVLLPLIILNMLHPFMEFSSRVDRVLDHVIEVLFVLCFAIVMIRILRIMEDHINHRFDDRIADNLKARKIRTQIQFIRKILVTLVVIVAISIVLLSFEGMRKIGAGMLTGVGLGGIIIGFAAQKSLGNLLAGFQIAFTQPVRMDDVLVVEGEWGRVEEITLTYVVLNIWDKRRLILPIQYFIEKPFQNWTRTTSEILGTVFLYADYSVPVSAIREELTRLLNGNPLWDGRVNVVHVTDIKEQTMEIRALMSCRNSGEAFDLRCYVREKMIDFLRRNYPDSLSRTRIELHQ